ncbi:EmrB/QacA subfamily drug resistance transporter [Hamadaea flava]|uniref:MFS transporter n=1 Tax=Hamadaea flava TaxID=1742688 RepID=A0ABV8LPP3_9ACTN|nr:MFS transporter [Hamadaea flava]MCP2323094.1 EmrB/QacA subfamily drug resistance transporter [Hamadaea flava]
MTAAPQNHPRRWVVLGVLIVSLLAVVLDNTVLNVALTTLADPADGLGASQSELEWSINSYTLVFAGFLLSLGTLGDRFGRKRGVLAGLVLFCLGSLLSAYAHSPAQLIGARVVMGLGAAAIMPLSLAIVTGLFSESDRPRAIAVWSGSVGIGVALGPIVGGLLLERFWWGSVFLINVPVTVAAFVVIALVVPEMRTHSSARVDAAGALLSIVALTSLTYGIIDGGDHGFDDARPWPWLAAGVVLLAVFVWWEGRAAEPALDLRLFRDARFSAANTAISLVFFAAIGAFFFIQFYLQLVRGFSPLKAGLLVTPFAVAQLVFAPASAALVRRFGFRAVCGAGLVLTAGALGGTVQLTAHTSLVIVGAAFFAAGIGMSLVMAPSMASVMASVPRDRASVGSATANTVRQVASALGIAVAGSILTPLYRAGIDPHLAGLPTAAREAAAEALAAAHAVAPSLGPAGPALVDAADTAFVEALRTTLLILAVTVLAATPIVARWLPGRRHEDRRASGVRLSGDGGGDLGDTTGLPEAQHEDAHS